MSDREKQLQVLLDNGIDEKIAVSMLNAMVTTEKKAKKKRSNHGFARRTKVNVPVVINQTCVTCKTETSFKRVMQIYSDELDIEQSCIVGQCVNCIKQYDLMSKDQLISLIILLNHSDVEIRGMSTATQIRMAAEKTAQEWLTTSVMKAIAWGDKDKDDCKED